MNEINMVEIKVALLSLRLLSYQLSVVGRRSINLQ